MAGATVERSAASSGAQAALRLIGATPGRRDAALAIVNGLFGDDLDGRDARLAIPMTIRAGSTVLPIGRRELADALATADLGVSSRICVFVHGLMSTESIWGFPGQPETTYGDRLAEDHDLTVLSLRYNTGRHISTNGREFARLLNQLVRAWPVRVREINLVGHSMGGLVIRSACHYGGIQRPLGRRLPIGRRWTTKVRRLVLIGVPNDGAGLEALVNSASAALATVPISVARLLGRGLDRRSAGIKDLRFGSIVDEDWMSADPTARERPHPHRPLRLHRADALTIAGTLTADPEHPVARLLGDALVTRSSASGVLDDIELIEGATTRVFPKISHNALAHHPDVDDAIASWWMSTTRRRTHRRPIT